MVTISLKVGLGNFGTQENKFCQRLLLLDQNSSLPAQN